MRRVLALVLVCATAVPASADGFYFTEALGGTDVKDELGAYMGSALRFRIAAGMRRGNWAVEAWLGAHIGDDEPTSDGGARWDGDASADPFKALTTYGVDLKYLQPMAKHLEVYLRGSVSAGFMDGAGLTTYAGRGLGAGAGIQLKGKVRALGLLFWPMFFVPVGPKLTGALYLDAGADFYRLHPAGQFNAGDAIDARLTTMTGGFAVGSDF
jgi:hypothetical protein